MMFKPLAVDEPEGDLSCDGHVSTENHAFGSRRRGLMAVAVGGGVLAIVVMRFLAGGPAQAIAQTDLDNRIDGFLGSAQDPSSSEGEAASQFSTLLESDVHRWQVPLSQLRCNPFLSGGASASAAAGQQPSAGGDAMLRRRMERMEVSMVMSGTVTVALVDGVRMPLGTQVRTEDDFLATLIAVGAHDLEVELGRDDGVVIRGRVPISPRGDSP
ncbi:MAG: hypothetical protein MK101_05540 [Phycisphaerales bacterium]|nr:hypothetical protein [Phycisphaerales bacterium]